MKNIKIYIISAVSSMILMLFHYIGIDWEIHISFFGKQELFSGKIEYANFLNFLNLPKGANIFIWPIVIAFMVILYLNKPDDEDENYLPKIISGITVGSVLTYLLNASIFILTIYFLFLIILVVFKKTRLSGLSLCLGLVIYISILFNITFAFIYLLIIFALSGFFVSINSK